jgi:hypothetical protein
MKHFSLLPVFLLASLFLVGACKEKEDPEKTYQLTLGKTELVFSAAGGSQDVPVTTDAPSWKPSASDSWISVSASGNTLTVTASENKSKDSRSGKVTVTGGGVTRELNVTQGGRSTRPADDPYPTAQYGLQDNSIFVPNKVCDAITSANPDKHTFVLPAAQAEGIKPEPGLRLIMNKPTEQFPDGLLAEVTGVKESGGNYEVTYRDLGLTEAFESLHIDKTYLDLEGAVKEILDYQGNPVKYVQTKAIGEKMFHFEIDSFTFPTPWEGVEFTPKISFDLGFLLHTIIDNGELYVFDLDTEIILSMGSDLSIGQDAKLVDVDIPILTIPFAAIPVGPILVTPFLELRFVFTAAGKVSLEFSGSYKGRSVYGVHYDTSFGWKINDYPDLNVPGTWKLEKIAPKVEGSVSYGLTFGLNAGIYAKVVSVGIEDTLLDKHSLSGEYDVLNGSAEDYLNWNLVQHLQNAEYAYTEQENVKVKVRFVDQSDVDLGGFDHTTYEEKFKVLPTLGSFPEFKQTDDGMELSVWVKNRNLLNGALTATIKENAHSISYGTMHFKDGMKLIQSLNEPDAPDSVKLTGFVAKKENDPDFNYADFDMDVVGWGRFNMGSFEQRFDDKAALECLRGILDDLAKCKAPGSPAWEDTHWHDGSSVLAMKGVRMHLRDGKFYYSITLPDNWKLGSKVIINEHTKDCDSFGGWMLWLNEEFASDVTQVAIYDSKLTDLQLVKVEPTDVLINSPAFTDLDDLSYHAFDKLDLSNTLFENLEFKGGSGIKVYKELVLENCPKLKTLSFQGDVPSDYLSVVGCTSLEEMNFSNLSFPANWFDNPFAGTEKCNLVLNNCKLYSQKIWANFKEILGNKVEFGTLELSGNSSVERLHLENSSGYGISVKSCPKFYSIYVPDTGLYEFQLEDLPEMFSIHVQNNKNLKSLVPPVFDQVRERAGSGLYYDVRYEYTEQTDGSVSYKDNGYGFWYEGEPACGYHGKEPPDSPEYGENPNDSKADAAFRKILKDIYECRSEKWEDCNWDDKTVPIDQMAHVEIQYRNKSDQRYKITIPQEWGLINVFKVRKHFEVAEVAVNKSGCEDSWWLTIEGERKFDSFLVSDPRLAQVKVQGEAKTFAIHSPYLYGSLNNGKFSMTEIPAKIKTLDLSGCDSNGIYYKTDAAHIPEEIIMGRAWYSAYSGTYDFECTDATPGKGPRLTIKNTTDKPMVSFSIHMTNLTLPEADASFVDAVLSDKSEYCSLTLHGCTAGTLFLPNMGRIVISGKYGSVRATSLPDLNELVVSESEGSFSADNLLVDSCENLKSFSDWEGKSSASIAELRNCKSLKEITGNGSAIKELRIENAPAVGSLEWKDASLTAINVVNMSANAYVDITGNKSLMAVMPDWLIARKTYSRYDVRYTYTYGSGDYTRQDGTKFSYTDKGYGFYYSDEPARGYH